jgi:hypothetical protein
LREKHRLRRFKNRVLRKIFGPKRDGVTGEWKENYIKKRLKYKPNTYSACATIGINLVAIG